MQIRTGFSNGTYKFAQQCRKTKIPIKISSQDQNAFGFINAFLPFLALTLYVLCELVCSQSSGQLQGSSSLQLFLMHTRKSAASKLTLGFCLSPQLEPKHVKVRRKPGTEKRVITESLHHPTKQNYLLWSYKII